jgi:putative flippase GtrA
MNEILQQFLQRDAGPVVQFLKYAIGGGVATMAHIFVFHLCAWKLLPALQDNDHAVQLFKLHVPEQDNKTRARNSMIDNGIAFMLSNFVAYLINIYWVFKPGRHHFLVEIGLFYAVSGVSMVIGTGIMGFLIRRYGMRTTYAFLANLVTALLINFAMRKFVIFSG